MEHEIPKISHSTKSKRKPKQLAHSKAQSVADAMNLVRSLNQKLNLNKAPPQKKQPGIKRVSRNSQNLAAKTTTDIPVSPKMRTFAAQSQNVKKQINSKQDF